MIIERCRELALRAPARVVFPDALDQRVLKAAQYLHQQGLATPILVANPFELRQFALSHGVAMDGLQVIDPHGNLAMREEFAHRWLARAGEKTPPDALEKLTDPLMFAAAMVSAGKADVCIAGNLSSTANVLRAGLRIIGLQPGCKTLSSIFLMLPQYSGPALGFADCSVVYAHKPGQMIVDECFGAGTDARSLTGAQLVQVTRRMAELIVEVIDGTLSPLAQALMQTGLLPAGVTPEIITFSGGVGECYRHQPADPFCFADIGPLLATALHDHPRLREMNVQFPAQTVRATVIGAGAHTLSLSGSTIWLEGVQLPLRNLPVAIPIDETDLVSAWQQALIQLDLDPKTDAYVLALPASLPVRYAAVLTVINALVDFVARFPNPHPLLVVAGQDFGKALGMLLRPQLQQLPLAVIDEVIVRAGDYIDIGTPLFGGSVVPVTVKSLAFPS